MDVFIQCLGFIGCLNIIAAIGVLAFGEVFS